MKILITGVAGFLGGRLAHWILEHVPGVEIIGIDDFSCGYAENVPSGVTLYQISLGQGHKLDRLLQGVDYAYHTAAYAAEGLSPFIRRYDATNNLLATIDVLNACLNVGTVKRLVFFSSMSVYGRGKPPFDEGDRRAPIDPYGVSKSAAEQQIEIAGEQHGLGYCIVRPHNAFGPYQSGWQAFRNVLAYWMVRHLEEKPLLIYGDGSQQRAFSYVDDMVPCLWRAAVDSAAEGQIVNLGGINEYTIQYAAESLIQVMGGGDIRYCQRRHEVHRAYTTWKKSVELLGFKHQTDLTEGLGRMWEWMKWAYEKYPERRGRHKVAEIEVERGLYGFWRELV